MMKNSNWTVALLAGAIAHSFAAPELSAQKHRPSDDLVATAQKAGDFGTLIAAAKAAGLASALQGHKDLTVFAPTDAAFAKLGKKTLQSLLRPENKAKLAAILKFHVLPGRVSAVDALSKRKLQPLLRNTTLGFKVDKGAFRVLGAKVLTNDVQAKNGVIHVIDRVLMPPASLLPQPRGRKIVGIYTQTPSRGLAAQLGIERGKATLITSTTKGGPAARAGIKAYDLIVEIDGRSGSGHDLARAKKAKSVGDEISFVVLRGGKRRHIRVPVGFEATRS